MIIALLKFISVRAMVPWFIPTITAAIWSYQFHKMFYRLEGDLLFAWQDYLRHLKREASSGNWWPFIVSRDDSYNAQTRNFMFVQTFFTVLLTVITLTQLCIQLFCNRKGKFKAADISAPKHFCRGMDIKSWLRSTDLYLDTLGVHDDRSRCISVISRLDSNSTKLLSGLGVEIDANLKDYAKLSGHLIHLFGERITDSSSAMREFSSRIQRPNENVSLYFSELNELGRLAFGNIPVENLRKIVDKQFSEGVSDNVLRIELLRAIDNPGIFSVPDVLTLARDFDKYSKPSVVVNVATPVCPCMSVRNNTLTPVICFVCSKDMRIKRTFMKTCHLCKVADHLYKYCPNKRLSVAGILNVAAVATDSIKSIVGLCSIEGNNCEFLVDTGAGQSIIRENIIAPENRGKIVPVDYRVLTMDGHVAQILGTYVAHMVIGDTTMVVNLLVTRDLVYDFLLGMDILTICPLTRPIIIELQEAVRVRCVNPLLFAVTEVHCKQNIRTGDVHLLQSIPEEKDDYNYSVDLSKMPNNVYHDVLQVIDSPYELETCKD